MRKGYILTMSIVIAVALAGALLLAALFLLQERMAFHPSYVIEFTPDAFGLEYHERRMTASDGSEITGWWLPAGGDAPALLFLHGNAGNISHRLHQLRHLREAGFSVLIIDYRGYGRSAGSPTEEGLAVDARAAWDHLTGPLGVDPGSVLLYGESIGSVPALRLASTLNGNSNGPAGLVLEGAFTSAHDMARRAFPFLPVGWILRLRMDNLSALEGLREPILFIHASRDEIVPFRMGRALYEAAEHPGSRFLEVAGAMHNSVWMTSPDELAATIREFAEEVTAPGPRTATEP